VENSTNMAFFLYFAIQCQSQTRNNINFSSQTLRLHNACVSLVNHIAQ